MGRNDQEKANTSLWRFGNKNAEKWTDQTIQPLLETMLRQARSGQYATIGEMLVEHGLYRSAWHYFKEKFKDDVVVFGSLELIDQVFENRIVRKALEGDYNTTMAGLVLKNCYGWRDRKEVTGDMRIGTHRMDLSRLSDDELATYKELIAKGMQSD